MSRIDDRLGQLAEQGRKALITYVVAGDPGVDETVDLLHALVAAGVDVLELGVPFSDPMAEGPVIQLGHERALANGITLSRVLDIVATFRREDQDTPLLLMGYANPVAYMGYAEFADAASRAGVDALLTVDIPPEEAQPVTQQLQRVGMNTIFLVAPTTPDERIAAIAEQASGFIYCVSLKGVTGAGHLDIQSVKTLVGRIKQASALPVAVGFGIRDGASARAIATAADGVVVGSALIDVVTRTLAEGGSWPQARSAAVQLIEEIRSGLD